MLEIKNLEALERQFEMWERDVRNLTEEVVKGYAIQAFHNLLTHSAQYSGDFAANWNVNVNYSGPVVFVPFSPTRRQMDRQGKTLSGETKPFIMGDSPAINEAKKRQAGTLNNFRLGDEIIISNVAEHNGEQYTKLIENNQIKFRLGNSGRPVAETSEFMKIRYKNLDGSDIQALRRLTL